MIDFFRRIIYLCKDITLETMDFSHPVAVLPLKSDSQGVVRIGLTRVTLDSVVGAFVNGATCEEIVVQFPSLDLGDVYAVIGFYLKNQAIINEYLAVQEFESSALRDKVKGYFPSNGIRERLLAKRRRSS